MTLVENVQPEASEEVVFNRKRKNLKKRRGRVIFNRRWNIKTGFKTLSFQPVFRIKRSGDHS